MTIRNSSLIVFVTFIALSFSSCEKPDPEIPNEEELITTLIYTLTPSSGGSDVVFTFRDLDGDGGNAPVITNGTLSENETYNASLTLLNEAESPTEDITEEIMEEDEDHQFFLASSISDVTISYNDTDSNGNPVGLSTIVNTGQSGQGNLVITLRHEPNKTANGVASGSIDNAGGETDIEVSFDLDVTP